MTMILSTEPEIVSETGSIRLTSVVLITTGRLARLNGQERQNSRG